MDKVDAEENDYYTSFNKKLYKMMNIIDIEDRFLVDGYIKNNIINKYKMDIPSTIINYCIFYYLYFEEEIFIGNFHRKRKNTSSRNKHIWTMFISSSKNKLTKPKSIKKVTYYLHPTFKKSTIIIKQSPFYLKRTGWGTFDIIAEIEFYEKYNKKTIKCSHYLDFDNYATITPITNDAKNDDNDDNDDQIFYKKSNNFPIIDD